MIRWEFLDLNDPLIAAGTQLVNRGSDLSLYQPTLVKSSEHTLTCICRAAISPKQEIHNTAKSASQVHRDRSGRGIDNVPRMVVSQRQS